MSPTDAPPPGPGAARIRIVQFADRVNRHDFIYNIAAHCDPARFESVVVTLNSHGTLNAEPGRITVVNLECARRLAYPRAIARLRRLLRAQPTAVLHSHHYEPSVLAAVALLGLPTRLVLGRHYSDTIYRFTRGLKTRFYLGIEGLCNARAAAVVAPSTVVERILLRQGVPAAKVLRIPYGLDLSRFETPAEAVRKRLEAEWPAGDGLRLLSVGRLHPEKGQEHLIEAMSLLRGQGTPTRVLFVGDGSDRGRLENRVAAHGLSAAIRFLGWREDILALMAAADAVVQPTLNEAFSQVMLEAMAMGRPLVISDVGGARDLIENLASGLIVPIGDAASMAAAIGGLVEPGVRKRMGLLAAQTIRERLDVRRIAREFEALYAGLVERTAPEHVA